MPFLVQLCDLHFTPEQSDYSTVPDKNKSWPSPALPVNRCLTFAQFRGFQTLKQGDSEPLAPSQAWTPPHPALSHAMMTDSPPFQACWSIVKCSLGVG